MAGSGALLGGLKKSVAAFPGPCFRGYGHAWSSVRERRPVWSRGGKRGFYLMSLGKCRASVADIPDVSDSGYEKAAYRSRGHFRGGVADGTRTPVSPETGYFRNL